MTTTALVAFDGFTDIDLLLPWDILNRVKAVEWQVNIIGLATSHRSARGLSIQTQAPLDTVEQADVVILVGGDGVRNCIRSQEFLEKLRLQPERQLIGAQCSGALILGTLGLLKGQTATTYPTAAQELRGMGVEVIEQPLVIHNNMATSGGCMSTLYLTAWILQQTVGFEEAHRVLLDAAPVGKSELFVSGIEDIVAKALQQK
jgi:transcriptional regulator GlxA family with amidase domain